MKDKFYRAYPCEYPLSELLFAIYNGYRYIGELVRSYPNGTVYTWARIRRWNGSIIHVNPDIVGARFSLIKKTDWGFAPIISDKEIYE